LCTSCGLCVGACPTATPFRTRSALIPGIDLPDLSAALLREQVQQASQSMQGDQRILVFACQCNPVKLRSNDNQHAVVTVSCMAQLPPPFIDYALSRKLADGVVLAGCNDGDCQYRFGTDWTEQRLNRQRDPHLRKRVDNSLIAMGWQPPWSGFANPDALISAFRKTVTADVDDSVAGQAETGFAKNLLRPVAMFTAFAIFLALAGLFSTWPRISPFEPGNAVVSLTFSHAGKRLQECRTLTQEELQKLPPNMRSPTDCPRERSSVKVSFIVDGQTLYEDSEAPSGIWNDGESVVYQRIHLKAGTHRMFIGMRDSNRDTGFDFQHEAEVEMAEGQHIVVEFDDVEQVFRFR
jgi:coenzyme F420-reducing hydrogenase delta subunit